MKRVAGKASEEKRESKETVCVSVRRRCSERRHERKKEEGRRGDAKASGRDDTTRDPADLASRMSIKEQ